jgi:arginase
LLAPAHCLGAEKSGKPTFGLREPGGMQVRNCSIIDAPSDLGLRPTGVNGLPDALRAAGLLDGIPGIQYSGRLFVSPNVPVRDPFSGVMNAEGIRAFSLTLADRTQHLLGQGTFPLVLGGDCSILVGTMLALRRIGRFGLFFIDGHADFYSPQAEPNGEVASMELAIVTGRDPDTLADLERRRPLVREEDVVVFGYRDTESAADHGSPNVRDTGMHVLDLNDVRRLGAAAAARQGLAAILASGLDGFWIHVDADVLNDDVMPAVDYRMPGGLWPAELTETLEVVLASPLATGMDLTIYNPDLDDSQHSAGRTLAAAITRAFATTIIPQDS